MSETKQDTIEELRAIREALTDLQYYIALHPSPSQDMLQLAKDSLDSINTLIEKHNINLTCPSCDSDNVTKGVISSNITYGDWPAVKVDHVIVVCENCEESFLDGDDYDKLLLNALQIILEKHAIPK